MEEQPSAVPVSADPSKSRLTLWICLGIALCTLIVFWPVHSYEFVNYDDPDYVTENGMVQRGLTVDGLLWALKTSYASNWHPLTWISHMIDANIYGPHAGGHHFTNILFHITNAILLFLLLNRLTNKLWPGAVVAAFFALHPMHVESVAWISERKDVLSAFFWLLTLLFYARYVAESRQRKTGYQISYGIALLCLVLGLLSKPMVVTLPFVLRLIDYWPLNRISKTMPQTEDQQNVFVFRHWTPFIKEKIPFFTLSIISCIITFMAQRKGGTVASLEHLPFVSRLANIPVAYLLYLEKLVWPQNQSVLYPHPAHWPTGLIVGSMITLVAVTYAVIRLGRRAPYLPVGWFWFLGTLIPVIGLVQVGVQCMADRYSYIPYIGLFVAIVWGIAEITSRSKTIPKIAFVAGVAVLFACGTLTAHQLHYWKNSETLFTRAEQVAYGNSLFRVAAQTSPAFTDIHNNLGRALADGGKESEAIHQYEMGLELNPNHAELNNNYGNLLIKSRRLDEAMPHLATALTTNPNFAEAHVNLGILLAMRGKYDDAIGHFQVAAQLRPYDGSVHSNLGNALAMQNRFEEALEQFSIVATLLPADPNAHFNLGRALAIKGRRDEAVAQFQEVLKLKPDFQEARFELNRLANK
jgi:protein O-mannosyl-transferase